jgi:hypothetical protein
MPHYSTGPYRIVPLEEYDSLFTRLAALPEDDIQEFHITINDDSVYDEVASVISYSAARKIVTLSLLNSGGIIIPINQINEVRFPELENGATPMYLHQIPMYPGHTFLSFDYVNARGVQSHVTGVIPGYIRPSDNHPGKNLLVGFKENEETGDAVHRTFRTDRITNLVRRTE